MLLLPIADVAAAAITYIRAYQAMRNVAAWTQYNPPPDLTTPATWPRLAQHSSHVGFRGDASSSTVAPPQPSTPGDTVNIYITALCGDPPGAACSAAAADPTKPKWFYLSASVKMNPIFLNLPALERRNDLVLGALPMKQLQQLLRCRRGGVALMISAAAVPLFLMSALGAEVGSWHLIRRHAQNAADAAAFAGALAITGRRRAPLQKVRLTPAKMASALPGLVVLLQCPAQPSL